MALLRQHRDVLDKLVDLLVAKEMVDGSEVYALVGRSEPAGSAGVTMAPDRPLSLVEDSTSNADASAQIQSPVGDPPG